MEKVSPTRPQSKPAEEKPEVAPTQSAAAASKPEPPQAEEAKAGGVTLNYGGFGRTKTTEVKPEEKKSAFGAPFTYERKKTASLPDTQNSRAVFSGF